MHARHAVRCLLACALLGGAPAHAKEPTRKLLIRGERLAGTIELVDSQTLALSDVFSGRFLGPVLSSPPPVATVPRYEVSFLVDDTRHGLLAAFGRRRLERAYVVFVVPDSTRHSVYVYVPGAGDTWSAWNRGTIVRADREGRWSEASPEWGRRIADAIARARRRAAPPCPIGTGVLLGPSDPVSPSLRALSDTLEAHGLRVLCAYHGTLDGTLGMPLGGMVLTPLGPFHATFFPSAADAARVRITSTVQHGELLTIVSGGTRERPEERYPGADRTDFLVHGHWLIDTFAQDELRDAIAQALWHRR